MKKVFIHPDEHTLYLTELERLESSLRTLRQRVSAARRNSALKNRTVTS